MTSRLRAHRWRVTLALTVGFAVAGWVSRGIIVTLPLLGLEVPARLLVAISTTVVMLTPLYSAFPHLERTLARETRMRVARAGTAAILALAAVTPAWAIDGIGLTTAQRTELPQLLVLMTISALAMVLLGDLAWAAPLGAGLVLLMVDAGPGRPVTTVLAATPPATLVAGLLAALALYVWRGPRAPA